MIFFAHYGHNELTSLNLGSNSSIVSYNANVVKFTTLHISILVRFENKILPTYYENTLAL
jgi:hypothetical protein